MCTITKHLEIRPAKRAAYDQLAHFHYRGHCPAVYTAIYAMYAPWHGHLAHVIPAEAGIQSSLNKQPVSSNQQQGLPIGVIVYTMPARGLEARNIAIGKMFDDCRNRTERMKMINKNIRCISRVIIDPRYRSLGLAARLVRETMPLMQAPIIEALAAMGQFNPFFEKAGMTAYPAKLSHQCEKMRHALNTVGIKDYQFLRPVEVQAKLDALDGRLKFWLEHQTQRFLNAYGKRRNMPDGIERTRFILSKLTTQPVYYIWVNRLACETRLSCDCSFSHV
jgi:hypothetical protein